MRQLKKMQPKKPRVIAVDYDDTITADKDMFTQLIRTMKRAGHTVIIVTARCCEPKTATPVLEYAKPLGIEVFFTAYKAKREFMASKGVKVDIWIDDFPELLVYDLDEAILMRKAVDTKE